jgi:MFS family permease
MLLWTGQATSMLGDQFHGIAAAWLVLKLTGDPLALGAVMAVGGIPRALFIVIGGAITDRISPRRVMLATDFIRLLLAAFFALQIFTGTLQVWMIYIYALVGGVMGGFFAPASMSIVPRLLPGKNLQAGNSLTQGSSQLIGFIGPALAGAMIAAFKDVRAGVGAAIAIDALTFIVSLVTLWLMRTGGEVSPASAGMRAGDVWKSIREGFAYMVKDPVLRLMFVIIAMANLCFGGPVGVGVPFLANTRFPGGAAAYGIILSGYAGGNLLGIIFSGALPRFSKKVMRTFMVVMFVLFGLGVALMAWIAVTWLATFDLFVMGVLNGYLSIQLITALQRITPKEMMGRLMSMVLLANMSVLPLSQAIGGAVLRYSPAALFVASGVLLLAIAVYLVAAGAAAMLADPLTEEAAPTPAPAD